MTSLPDTGDLSLQVRSLTLSASRNSFCCLLISCTKARAWPDTPCPESCEPHTPPHTPTQTHHTHTHQHTQDTNNNNNTQQQHTTTTHTNTQQHTTTHNNTQQHHNNTTTTTQQPHNNGPNRLWPIRLWPIRLWPNRLWPNRLWPTLRFLLYVKIFVFGMVLRCCDALRLRGLVVHPYVEKKLMGSRRRDVVAHRSKVIPW